MHRISSVLLASFGFFLITQSVLKAGGDAKKTLEGVWIGQSMEVDGKALPAEEAKRMRLTFKGDKLLIRGNFKDDRELECDYKVDAKQSPHHLDFTPRNEKKSLQGIYDVKDGVLKVCMSHETGSEGRPKMFATKAGSQLILVVFNKQKP
jgi:uncharacterized protein (TIGR03067 family)